MATLSRSTVAARSAGVSDEASAMMSAPTGSTIMLRPMWLRPAPFRSGSPPLRTCRSHRPAPEAGAPRCCQEAWSRRWRRNPHEERLLAFQGEEPRAFGIEGQRRSSRDLRALGNEHPPHLARSTPVKASDTARHCQPMRGSAHRTPSECRPPAFARRRDSRPSRRVRLLPCDGRSRRATCLRSASDP